LAAFNEPRRAALREASVVSNEPVLAEAQSIAEVLRGEAGKCFQLAKSEPRPERREGYLSLAYSYEETASAIVTKAKKGSRPAK
jgi:hypothetical protein